MVLEDNNNGTMTSDNNHREYIIINQKARKHHLSNYRRGNLLQWNQQQIPAQEEDNTIMSQLKSDWQFKN